MEHKELVSEIESIILKKYEEIKEEGNIIAGITKLSREIKWENYDLGMYIEKRLWKLADQKG